MQDIGFTGTRAGLTAAQKRTLAILLSTRPGPIMLHHGDCIGADAQADEVARHLNHCIHLHPPTDRRYRAFCKYDRTEPETPYLARNKHIVNQTEFLIACPKEIEEVLRSGTWATIRYAKKMKKPIKIIWPDGSITHWAY